MIAVNYSIVRQNFKYYCDKEVSDSETVIITLKKGENVVIMSESKYNNL